MAEAEVIQSVAKELRTAEDQRTPVAPVAARFGDLSLADAYAVQLANVALRLGAGDRVVGRKIGLTSLAMQTQLGVDQPDYGHLLASMAVPNGGAATARARVAPPTAAGGAVLPHPVSTGAGVPMGGVPA